MTLQEICAEKREKLGITYQQIADQSDLPLSTVKKYFSADSKTPAITTAGPICKVLGVSIAVAFQQIDSAPDAKTGTESHDKGLKNSNCRVEKCHSISSKR